jgi:hypothetical protein
MEKKQLSDIVFGVIIFCIGSIFLLQTLNIIHLNLFNFSYWPFFIILTGISIVLKRYGLAVLFVIFALIIGSLNLIGNSFTYSEQDLITESYNLNLTENRVSIEIDFGGGELKINQGNSSNIYVQNSYLPIIFQEVRDDIQFVDISNVGNEEIFLSRLFSNDHDVSLLWELTLQEDYLYDFDINTGAMKGLIDLRNLNVGILSIDSGAADIEIYVRDSIKEIQIDSGATELTLFVPENSSVKVSIDSGLTSLQLDGFRETTQGYLSKHYDEHNFIDIEIDAGASDISIMEVKK